MQPGVVGAANKMSNHWGAILKMGENCFLLRFGIIIPPDVVLLGGRGRIEIVFSAEAAIFVEFMVHGLGSQVGGCGFNVGDMGPIIDHSEAHVVPTEAVDLFVGNTMFP